jgi:hypothetical protein
VARVDDLAAAIEAALGSDLPPGLLQLVAGVRASAEALSPAALPCPMPEDLPKRREDLGKDLDALEDILEAFVLFGPPPAVGSERP